MKWAELGGKEVANEEEESALGKGGKGRLGTEPGAKERLRKLGSARWFIFRNKQVNKKNRQARLHARMQHTAAG